MQEAENDKSGTPIRMWYFKRIHNIGDMINPNLVTSIAHVPVIRSSDFGQPHLFGVGSILGGAHPQTIVWGSGLMDPDQSPSQIRSSNIYAVRGKLTYSQLKKDGISLGDIPLGDPGYLASELFAGRFSKKWRLGIIPHYVDRWHPFVQSLLTRPDVIDINVHSSPEVFFATLQSCEAIISSSLHGLIFAESFNIPNAWIKLSDRVIRTGFKFRDWFSLADEPEDEPYVPTGSESVRSLIDRTKLHSMHMDKEAIRNSFPVERIDELKKAATPGNFKTTPMCRKRPLPIFVISFNRPEFLRRVIESYDAQRAHVEIIVHDNGSDDTNTIDLLNQLEKSGVDVYRRGKINDPEELNNINETIDSYFSGWGEPSRYIVTDCDIDLSESNPLAIDVYDTLLNRFTDAECVGPMLRISDIPYSYPQYRQVMQRHIEQFWNKTPEWITTEFGDIATQECLIDTTFALHRAGEPFRRLKKARRVYFPFEAKHLDWYLEGAEYHSSTYYHSSSPAISHWNTPTGQKSERPPAAEHQFICVERKLDGSLAEVTTYR